MYRLQHGALLVLTILSIVIGQDTNEDTILNDFLQQIENQCSRDPECEFTDEEIEQILEECKTATQNIYSTVNQNLELCQKYELSEREIQTLLNQYITFLESGSESTQYDLNKINPYVMIKK